jgi:hypothetical protein
VSEFKIEKGVPIPERHNGGRGFVGVLLDMKQGDSVVISRFQEQGFRSAACNKCIVTIRRIDEKTSRLWVVKNAPKVK